jgi:hypothetical protein
MLAAAMLVAGCATGQRADDVAGTGGGADVDFDAANVDAGDDAEPVPGDGGSDGADDAPSDVQGAVDAWPDASPAGEGHASTEVVSAGGVMQGAGYRMVFTLGQPTPAQTGMSSSHHRLQGGIVGATGSLP